MNTDKIVVIKEPNGKEVGWCAEDIFYNTYSYNVAYWFQDNYNLDSKYDYRDYIIEHSSYQRKEHISFYCGNVVRWNGSLYVVSSFTNREGNRRAVLLPFNHCNSSSHPSDVWPDDPRIRISSVERVAPTIKDYLIRKFESFMGL